MTSNQIETQNCLSQDKVESEAQLSSDSTKSSKEIDTVSVEDVEKLASEIAPEYKNWCPPENYDEIEVNNDIIVNEDWKMGDIEYGRWTNQFDDAEESNTVRAPL